MLRRVSRRTLTLPAEPASAQAARRFVRDALRELDREDVAWAAQQIVSELATNALLHARTTMDIAVSVLGDGVRVEVLDGSSVAPRVRHYGGESTTGRGLRMVEELATSWGVDRLEAGKVVWVELAAGDGGGRTDASAFDVDADLEAVLRAFPDSDPRHGGAGGAPRALLAA